MNLEEVIPLIGLCRNKPSCSRLCLNISNRIREWFIFSEDETMVCTNTASHSLPTIKVVKGVRVSVCPSACRIALRQIGLGDGHNDWYYRRVYFDIQIIRRMYKAGAAEFGIISFHHWYKYRNQRH